MAFRKTVRCNYRSPLSNVASFGEIEFADIVGERGEQFVQPVFVDNLKLSKRTLDVNVFTSKRVLESGEVISGNVDFTPTDPDNIERSVERGVASFIENNPVNPVENEN